MCIRDGVVPGRGADEPDGPAAVLQRRAGLGQLGAGAVEVCLLYTSDAADERSSVDLGGRRIIKKKNTSNLHHRSNSL